MKSSDSCAKHAYATSHEARIAIAKTKARAKERFRLQRPYLCETCGLWHLTSMTKEQWQQSQRIRKQMGKG